jgi:hypothetical protein
MKNLIFTLVFFGSGFATQAQELAPDQNLNYKVSMDKYKATQANLQTTMNTTVQDTYKAYDFRVARAERKAERRSYRRESMLYNNYNNDYDYDNYGYNNYNYRYNNGYNYSSPYRSNRYNNNHWFWCR